MTYIVFSGTLNPTHFTSLAALVSVSSCVCNLGFGPQRIFPVMDYLDFRVYACAAHADTESNSVGNK